MPRSACCGLRLRARSGKTAVVLNGFQNECDGRAPPPLRFRWALLALVTFCAAGSCGPSVQSIYEGNVRFEHCYRLDLEVDTAPTHRRACWSEWLSRYTYGQPRDRIEYARRRMHAFSNGDADRPSLDIGEAKKTEARQFYLVVPAPTSAHAPPPPIATRWFGDAGTSPTSPTSPTAPTAPTASASEQVQAPQAPQAPPAPQDKCSLACRETFVKCQAPCDADAGQPQASCKSCDGDYKTCMKRCFQ
jgi:hypothetical protein